MKEVIKFDLSYVETTDTRKELARQRLVRTSHEHVGEIRQEVREIKHVDGKTDATSLLYILLYVLRTKNQ
jgi:hypothetical protein